MSSKLTPCQDCQLEFASTTFQNQLCDCKRSPMQRQPTLVYMESMKQEARLSEPKHNRLYN